MRPIPTRRPRSATVSHGRPQALFLLNHRFVLAQAEHLAERLAREVRATRRPGSSTPTCCCSPGPPRAEEIEICPAVPRRGQPKRCGRGLGRPGPRAAVQQRIRVSGLTRFERGDIHGDAALSLAPRIPVPRRLLASASWRWPTCWPKRRRRSLTRSPTGRPIPTRSARRITQPAPSGCIFLYMPGGPSHVDLFDPKPRVAENNGKPLPFEKPKLERTKTGNLLASPWKFSKHGQSGIEVSELLPRMAVAIDDLCVIRSMVADNINHTGAALQMAPASRRSRGPAWARGSPTVWGPRTRTCPASWSSVPPRFSRARSSGLELPAQRVPGDAGPRPEESDRQPRRSVRRPRAAARQARRAPPAQRDPQARPGDRQPARRPDRLVRTGIPHADEKRPRHSTSRARARATQKLYGIDNATTDNSAGSA